MKLSPHFTLREATKSTTAERNGIDNTPPTEVISCLRAVAQNILEPPRVHFGKAIAPSSWFRCLELNRLIGSRDTSQHVQGEAVDFEVPGIDNLELAHWMVDNTDFDKIILEFYDGTDPFSGWIHASYISEEENRRETYTITKGKGTGQGLP